MKLGTELSVCHQCLCPSQCHGNRGVTYAKEARHLSFVRGTTGKLRSLGLHQLKREPQSASLASSKATQPDDIPSTLCMLGLVSGSQDTCHQSSWF